MHLKSKVLEREKTTSLHPITCKVSASRSSFDNINQIIRFVLNKECLLYYIIYVVINRQKAYIQISSELKR
jgi:hypothetical protein